MGVSRLLAKFWLLICLFAGAHSLRFAVQAGGELQVVGPQVLVAVSLFAAMGLLFVGGYGVSKDAFHTRVAALFKVRRAAHTMPLFNDLVFVVFVVVSFVVQVWYAPGHVTGRLTDALEGALYFAVPGHAVVVDRLGDCALDGGRVFASSFAWLLAVVFAGSAISRLKQTADAMRIDRVRHPQSLSPTALATVLGVTTVFAVQGIFVGSALSLLPCSAYAGLPGAVLIGLAPLVFAYLVYAALAALLASGGEK
jgi:hypothetical protein